MRKKNKKMSLSRVLSDSLRFENSFLVLLLGLCPMLIASTRLSDAVVTGTVALLTLVFSALVSKAFSKAIPDSIKTLAHILVTVSFIAIFELLIYAFLPSIWGHIGMYLPLIAVSGLTLYSFEGEKKAKTLSLAVKQALVLGVAFFASITVLAIIREFFGRGSLLEFQIFPEEYGMLFLTLPGGGLILMGVLIAFLRAFVQKIDKEEKK